MKKRKRRKRRRRKTRGRLLQVYGQRGSGGGEEGEELEGRFNRETGGKNKKEAAQTLNGKMGRGKETTADVDSQRQKKEKMGGASGKLRSRLFGVSGSSTMAEQETHSSSDGAIQSRGEVEDWQDTSRQTNRQGRTN